MCLSLVRCVQVYFPNMFSMCSAGVSGSQKCYTSIVEDLNFSDVECLKYSLSKGLGVGIVVGGSIMKVPQLLLSTRSVRNITSSSPRADVFSSPICSFRPRNLSEFLHSRNLLLPRYVRVLISQRVPILNVRGEHFLGAAKHRHHPSHHLLPLFHTAKIGLFQQFTEGCRGGRCLCCPDRHVGYPSQGNNRIPPNDYPPPWVILQAPPDRTEPQGKVHRTVVHVCRCGANPWLSRQIIHDRHRS